MTDIWNKEKRSHVMSRIRSIDTTPELLVRSLLHRMGYRFRLHKKDLPGKPDIVLPKYSSVAFVHGCFWHQHPGCIEGRIPDTRVEYWKEKLNSNINRDKKVRKELKYRGWRTIVIWECEIEKNPSKVKKKLKRFLI